MNFISQFIARWLAEFLEKPSRAYKSFSITDTETLKHCMQPGDVLLVEGNFRISVAVKYLTQSTWSHATMYVGDALGDKNQKGEPLNLVEVDLTQGVIAVPLSTYSEYNTRICRPVNLKADDKQELVQFMLKEPLINS